MPRELATSGTAAVQLRVSGASFADIATTLGLSKPRDAVRLVSNELARQAEEDTDERDRLRRETNMQLEACIKSVYRKATNPESDEHLPAVRTLITVLDRRAKLNGLDAPTEVLVHNPTQTELDQWVAMMVEQSMPNIEEGDIIEGEIIE
jgi:hypothetical protein